MRRRIFYFLIPVFVFVVGITYVVNNNTLPTITYFPLDKQNEFLETQSLLEFSHQKGNNSYNIAWTSNSESNHNLYLRQDASLLFDNGLLRGVRSKWEQDTASIQITENLSGKDNSFFQVITYHHGEVHYPDDTIKSIQHMSHDKLYVGEFINIFRDFRKPHNTEETNKQKELEKKTKKQLLYHWDQLIKHFHIDETAYTSVPLTHLYNYNQKALPGMSQTKTDQIIGQLWEGLYKNYIIPAAKSKKNAAPSNYVPLILFDKQDKHLLVIFELNGKKEKLIQQYPND